MVVHSAKARLPEACFLYKNLNIFGICSIFLLGGVMKGTSYSGLDPILLTIFGVVLVAIFVALSIFFPSGRDKE